MKKVSEKSAKSFKAPFILTVVVAVLIVALFLYSPVKKSKDGEEASRVPSAAVSERQDSEDLKGGAMIQSVRLQPVLPTRLDSLRAEVVPIPRESGPLKYVYEWRVNEQVIAEATGDTLDLSPFKKRDLVSVTVTPYQEDTAGYPVRGPIVAIQSIPPSLEMKVIRKTAKIGEPCGFQLISDHPDSETVTFSLEEPKVGGMAIDGKTGKVTWIIGPDQQGIVRFGTAVQDTEGTRVTKIFEISLDQPPQAASPPTP